MITKQQYEDVLKLRQQVQDLNKKHLECFNKGDQSKENITLYGYLIREDFKTPIPYVEKDNPLYDRCINQLKKHYENILLFDHYNDISITMNILKNYDWFGTSLTVEQVIEQIKQYKQEYIKVEDVLKLLERIN